jgi:hypothetical protein
MMTENKPGFSTEQRADNDNRKSKPGPPIVSAVSAKSKHDTFRQRWNALQLSKTFIVWICLAMIAGTMLVGFTWGGWVTSGTAQQTAATVANDAVVQRLAAICVAQFHQDADGQQKLVTMKESTSYQQTNFVKEQGWSTMPGDEQSDSKVAAACAKQLALLN